MVKEKIYDLKKPHFFQRWYEMTPEERINKRNIEVFYSICILAIALLLLFYTLFTPIEVSCTSGKVGININLNSTGDIIGNYSIKGIDGLACHAKFPFILINGID